MYYKQTQKANEIMLEANHPKLFYDFPNIVHLDDVLKAIEGRDEFVVADRGDHVIVNYNVGFVDTFPEIRDSEPEEERIIAALRREARGIVFDKETGKVLSRRFHKFFNVGERPSTEMKNVDISRPHVILEKLDGSMITPLLLNDEVRWGTKMGLTDTAKFAEDFANKNPKYEQFVKEVMEDGKTPIFEYMSRQTRIIVDYKHDAMVLTAIRFNESGDYVDYPEIKSWAEKFAVDVVRALPGNIENMESFMEEVRDLQGSEGYVLRFTNGHMVKMKSSWYIGLHKAKDAISSEKNVVKLTIDKSIDDLKAFMIPDDIVKLDKFNDEFWRGIDKTVSEINVILSDAEEEMEKIDFSMFENGESERKKYFATKIVPLEKKIYSSILFKAFNGADVKDLVIDIIYKSTGTQAKVDNVRELFNSSWQDIYYS